jgi:NAD(P)-dependent dehydrogenase (short-subunit alcohol dehydrogenase family)
LPAWPSPRTLAGTLDLPEATMGPTEWQGAATIPDDDGLRGRVALVSGAGAAGDGIGNGRAAAILLARAGAFVACVDRDGARAARTLAMLREAGGDGLAVEADVTRDDACAAMVGRIVAHCGRLDIVDNNVGVGGANASVDGESVERWHRIMKINVDSAFLVSRHAVPSLRASGGGAIVNVASISALRPSGLTAYSTAKGAVIALTRAMAVDHAPDGIRVNCVAPGPVYTPLVAGAGMDPAARAARAGASLLGVEGSGWDVGHAVRFLASRHAHWITGQVLVVDGGVTLRSPQRPRAT